jgi:uncharacterized protein GlcG (DUF336 family)
MLKRGIVMAGLVIALSTQALANEDEALVSFKVMTLETAQELAQATLDDCRKRGYQVAVSVVDRSGVLQVTLRDRFAGAHTPETARRKAWTSVSFRTDTLPMVEETQHGRLQAGARHVTDALMVGGGVLVRAAGSIVGGVGVSGAPGGDLDDACARVGIEAIADKLEF